MTLAAIPDGDFVFSLAADTWVQKRGVDPRDALPYGFDLALLRGPSFVNSDVMMMRNSEKVREFFNAAWDAVPMYAIDNQDAILHARLGTSDLKVNTLDDRWNFFDTWHGEPKPVTCKKEDAIILHWASKPRAEVLKDFQKLAS